MFPCVKLIGCFYHFVRAVKENFKRFNHLENEVYGTILNDVFNLPFSFSSENYTNVDAFCNKYRETFPEFIGYFESQWLQYFKNGMLNYSYLPKKFRSNSYIENYNRRIKLKLSKYLFGKSKTKISWPLFIFFIRNEEDEYRLENIKFDNSIEIKNINLNNSKDSNIKIEYSEKSEFNINRKWLKFNTYSCRYDSFIFIYTFVIRLYLEKHKLLLNNPFVELYNFISEEILNMDELELNNGIWQILNRYKKITLF